MLGRPSPGFRGVQTTGHEPARLPPHGAIETSVTLNHPAEVAPKREAEHPVDAAERLRERVLIVTTIGYIGCSAVWTIFAIIGIEIQRQYGLSDAEFGLLVGAPFLSGLLMRVVLGAWADR